MTPERKDATMGSKPWSYKKADPKLGDWAVVVEGEVIGHIYKSYYWGELFFWKSHLVPDAIRQRRDSIASLIYHNWKQMKENTR